MESLMNLPSVQRPQVSFEKAEDEPVDLVGTVEVGAVPGAVDHVVLGIPLPFGPSRHRLADVAGSVELADDQLRRNRNGIAGFRMNARGDTLQDFHVLVLRELVERAAQALL